MPLPSTIATIEHLKQYLHVAMQLEHATIPPYLTALYSMRPLANPEAAQILRVVAVEEMLHLALAANILNAVGGRPDVTAPGFVPSYPAYLPDGETDFQVDLRAFSVEAVQMFLKIERPKKIEGAKKAEVAKKAAEARAAAGGATFEAMASASAAASEDAPLIVPHRRAHRLTFGAVAAAGAGLEARGAAADETGMAFYSIGEFYREIINGLKLLSAQSPGTLFSGDPAKQVTGEFYYSGGGGLFAVTDLDSAVRAADLIIGQGEGEDRGLHDDKGELAHFYRFQQLLLGSYYNFKDEPCHPSGPPLKVDWSAVCPIKTNAKLADYPEGSEVRAAAAAFNNDYKQFLALLNEAFNGNPQLLTTKAVPWMFRIRNSMTRLVNNPIPGADGVNAAPTFEIDT